MKKLESSKRVVKEVSKRRYRVSIKVDETGVYHIESENLLTHKLTSVSLIDYGMAMSAFDARIANFEGV